MTEEVTPGNVFEILPGGKTQVAETPAAESDIPQNEYMIAMRDGTTLYADGFLLFTSQHVAVMRDTGNGALPVLVVPLGEVLYSEIVEDDEVFDGETELPF